MFTYSAWYIIVTWIPYLLSHQYLFLKHVVPVRHRPSLTSPLQPLHNQHSPWPSNCALHSIEQRLRDPNGLPHNFRRNSLCFRVGLGIHHLIQKWSQLLVVKCDFWKLMHRTELLQHRNTCKWNATNDSFMRFFENSLGLCELFHVGNHRNAFTQEEKDFGQGLNEGPLAKGHVLHNAMLPLKRSLGFYNEPRHHFIAGIQQRPCLHREIFKDLVVNPTICISDWVDIFQQDFFVRPP